MLKLHEQSMEMLLLGENLEKQILEAAVKKTLAPNHGYYNKNGEKRDKWNAFNIQGGS